jgi:hypothetical protein
MKVVIVQIDSAGFFRGVGFQPPTMAALLHAPGSMLRQAGDDINLANIIEPATR